MHKYAVVSYDDSVSDINFKMYNTYNDACVHMKAEFDELVEKTIRNLTDDEIDQGEFDLDNSELAEVSVNKEYMLLHNIKENKRVVFEVIKIIMIEHNDMTDDDSMYVLLMSDSQNWMTRPWPCLSLLEAQVFMNKYFNETLEQFLNDSYSPDKINQISINDRITVEEDDNRMHIHDNDTGLNYHFEIKKVFINEK